MASGSTNKSTGSSTRTNTAKKASTQTRTKATTTTRRKRQAMNDQMFEDIMVVVSGAICIFLFLCNFGIVGSFGSAISSFMFGIFGLFAYVAPLFTGNTTVLYVSLPSVSHGWRCKSCLKHLYHNPF